jgi:replicative DNA helicase
LSLSQLSRAVEQRVTKRPQLSDLRDSGSIEQDADVVMFLSREEDDNQHDYVLDIAKHRNGPLGSIKLFFKGDRVKFFGAENRRSSK